MLFVFCRLVVLVGLSVPVQVINVKKLVYLQLITAKWHIENSKNNERWFYYDWVACSLCG